MSESGGTTPVQQSTGTAASVVSADSGNLAAAAGTATLAAAAGKTNYVSGFCVAGLGATAGTVVLVTVTGTAQALNYPFTVPTGAGVAAQPLVVEFPAPIPASAPNTAIVLNIPSFGAGNTNARGTLHGNQF